MSKILAVTVCAVFFAARAWAHCEIPCGIYDDRMRIGMITEDIMTIEKSMEQINALSEKGDKNYNQLIRWVNNKEEHALKIQHIVAQYFMAQRIKADDKDYLKKITALHKILVAAMKAKQTTDLKYIEELRLLVSEFEELYF